MTDPNPTPQGIPLDTAPEELNASLPPDPTPDDALKEGLSTITRDEMGRFTPGSMGWQGRRPLTTLFRMRCRAFMDQKGWAALEALALNPKKPDSQHRALELIAAYAYGRPAQRHEVLVDDTGARSLVDGLTQMMAEQIARRRLAERVVEGEVVREQPDAV